MGSNSKIRHVNTSLGPQFPQPSLGTTGPYFPPRHDLISLVEKGRIGMSSNSSCCSSTTSSVGEKHGVLPTTKITNAQINNESLQR